MQNRPELQQALAAWRSALNAPQGDRLVSALRELDALRSANASAWHPQLVHYLERRSYEKAERWLAGDTLAETHLAPGDRCTKRDR